MTLRSRASTPPPRSRQDIVADVPPAAAQHHGLMGTLVRKNFDGVLYSGVVVGVAQQISSDGSAPVLLYRIAYEDGDEEDAEASEVLRLAQASPSFMERLWCQLHHKALLGVAACALSAVVFAILLRNRQWRWHTVAVPAQGFVPERRFGSISLPDFSAATSRVDSSASPNLTPPPVTVYTVADIVGDRVPPIGWISVETAVCIVLVIAVAFFADCGGADGASVVSAPVTSSAKRCTDVVRCDNSRLVSGEATPGLGSPDSASSFPSALASTPGHRLSQLDFVEGPQTPENTRTPLRGNSTTRRTRGGTSLPGPEMRCLSNKHVVGQEALRKCNESGCADTTPLRSVRDIYDGEVFKALNSMDNDKENVICIE